MSQRRALFIVMGSVLLASACAPQGLAFVQDDRLEIVEPEAHTEVSTPVTVRWTVEDFEITGADGDSHDDAGYFGVFVDRTPVPPGEPLSWIAQDDQRCLNTEGCPDEVYLADRRVYSTTASDFTMEKVPDLDTSTGRETHEVTIVLLDGTGRRIGESAWYVTFFYERDEEV